VKTFECRIEESRWEEEERSMVYNVKANRFLRGMVRGLVGTMLRVGRGKMGVEEFRKVIEGGDASEADFSVPGHGLYLEEVGFRAEIFG
jgi:tRNA pseudouridine38-40 synthase